MYNKETIVVGTICLQENFEVGDLVCHINNYKNGLPFFSKASEDDIPGIGKYLVLKVDKHLLEDK